MDEPQDWGIINGSTERLDEFVQEYQATELSPVERSLMASLVLASANERLLAESDDPLTGLTDLLPRIANDAGWELKYWGGLAASGFPLGQWLRDHNS